ncbi:MAG: chromosome partitioning protein, partial [Sphingobium sp.]
MAASLDIDDTHDLLSVATLAQRTSSVQERLRDSARSARAADRREPTFPIGKAADLVGRTPA